MAGRGQKTGPADQPPKRSDKRTKRTSNLFSSSADQKDPYAGSSSTSSSTAHPELHWPATQNSTHKVEDADPDNLSKTEETRYLDGFFAADDGNIDAIDFNRIYSLPPYPHAAAAPDPNFGFGDARENEIWGRSYLNDQLSLAERHQAYDYEGSSLYPQEERQGETSHAKALFPLKPVNDYQLGKWAHNTRNEDITITEKMEKSNWESGCSSRL